MPCSDQKKIPQLDDEEDYLIVKPAPKEIVSPSNMGDDDDTDSKEGSSFRNTHFNPAQII